MEEFKKRSLPFDSAYEAELTRVQRRLKWATVSVPLATLFYGLSDIRVGVNYFHMSTVFAAVVALLFTAVTTPLIEWIGVGSRRAVVAARKICRAYSWVFLS